MQGTASTQRPMGVTILAVLAIIGGVLGILGGILILLGGGLIAASGVEGAAAVGGLVIVFAILSIVIGALYLAFGIGAWGLKPWAWMLGVIGAGLSLLSALFQIIFLQSDITSQIVGIAISIIILVYLFTPPVKQAFGRA
jgi:hypothetical protein